MDSGWVKHLAEPEINESMFIGIFVHPCNPVNIWQISLSSFVYVPKEVSPDLWLSSISDAEKYVRLYVGLPGSELSSSSSIKMLT